MSTNPDVPDLVAKALRASLTQGFIETTRTETGRLLAMLAATRTGTIGELGTGCGVGAAWLRWGAPAETRVVTAELNPDLAHCAQSHLGEHGIEVVEADWRDLGSWGPFSLLFVDAGSAKRADRDQIIELLDAGGIIVIDDLVPCDMWPPTDHLGVPDHLRVEWLTDPRLMSVEVSVVADTSAFVAVRR